MSVHTDTPAIDTADDAPTDAMDDTSVSVDRVAAFGAPPWRDRRLGAAVAAAVPLLWGVTAAWRTPRGPLIAGEALWSNVISLAVGTIARGLHARARTPCLDRSDRRCRRPSDPLRRGGTDHRRCQWSRTGKSYPALDPATTVTLDGSIDDTIAVTDHLRDRFGQERIFLLGQSWGTTLGVLAVQEHPEVYEAFIGVGQMVSPLETGSGRPLRLCALSFGGRVGCDGREPRRPTVGGTWKESS